MSSLGYGRVTVNPVYDNDRPVVDTVRFRPNIVDESGYFYRISVPSI